MADQKKSHSDSISLAGFYYGVSGTFLGAAGIALSVYYSNSGEKNLWLSLSRSEERRVGKEGRARWSR